MKLGIVLLSIALIVSIVSSLFFLWKSIDGAITVDHLGVEIARCHKREAALLRLSRAFAASMSNDALKAYIRSNMGDLDITDQDQKFIVNGVGIEFDTIPPTIE